MTARHAFSYLELMLVVAIMGIFAAIAIPRYANSIVRYRAGAAAQRVEADLVLARERARLTSQNVTVAFDPVNETVSIPLLAGLNHRAVAYLTDLTEEPYVANIVSAVFNDMQEVTFNGFGIPDNGGTVKVCAGDVTMMITLDANTGEVNVQ